MAMIRFGKRFRSEYNWVQEEALGREQEGKREAQIESFELHLFDLDSFRFGSPTTSHDGISPGNRKKPSNWMQ